MFGSHQQRIGTVLWLGFLVLIGGHVSAETVVRPLVDRPGGCAYCEATLEAMATATATIDALLSSAKVEANPLLEGLVAAHQRGVVVRVLLDASDWAPEITESNGRALSYLQEHGIEARFDDPAVTTHAKMLIVDRRVAVIGSTNWNDHAFYDHEQANVLIEDARIGHLLTEYFERLWEQRLAPGGLAIDLEEVFAGPSVIVPLPDTEDTSLYATLLLELLPRAQRSVHVAMYRMSVYPNYPDSVSNRIASELLAAAGRGVDVKVLLDDCRYYEESAKANLASAIYLYQHGIEVRFDRPEETTHAKLVVVDGASVVLGSTNWNYYSLEKNVEVSIAFLQIPAIAGVYEAYFQSLWREGRTITP